MNEPKASGLILKTIKKLMPLVGLFLLGAILHAQDSEETLNEMLASVNAGFNNVEVELLEWPGELHDNLGAMHKFAYLTRPVESTFEKLPLIVSLHGGGSKWWEKSLVERLEISAEINKKQGYDLADLAGKELIMLEPNTTADWKADELDAMLDYVLEKFPEIDKDRLYVTGYSKGGAGTWIWLNKSVDRFAAAAIGGNAGGSLIDDVTKLVNLPLWLIVGSDDGPAKGTQNMVNQLRAAGNVNVELTVIEGGDHKEAGDAYFSSVEMVDWLLRFPLAQQPEDWVPADQIDWFWQEGGEPTFPNEAYGPEVLVDPDKLPSGTSNVGDNQLFDVWVPNGVGPFPIYVYAHGGGFKGGSKRRMVLSGPLLQNDNVVYVNTNYRLHGGTPEGVTDAINDVVALLEYLKTNKEKYKINPDQIFLGGASAGGIIMNHIVYNEIVTGIKGLWQWNLYRNEGQSVDLQDQELLAKVNIPVVHAHPDLYPNDNSHSALDAFNHSRANWQAGSSGIFFKATKEHPSAIGYEDPYDQIEQIWIDGHWELDSRDGTDTGERMPNLAEWIYKIVNWGVTTSINESHITDRLEIVPNPVISQFSIAVKPVSTEIYNLSGKLIKKYPEGVSNFDISSLNPGVYILKVKTKKGNVIVEKIVKY